MKKWFMFAAFAALAACGVEGKAGDACESDDDCGDGLHCHIHDGAGECDAEHEDTGEHGGEHGEET